MKVIQKSNSIMIYFLQFDLGHLILSVNYSFFLQQVNGRLVKFNHNKMLSQAGKIYTKTRVVSPLNTKQRFSYYQLAPITSPRRQRKIHHTLDTNLREKRDSYQLRYAKDITVNTNYHPQDEVTSYSPPRPFFPRASFQRYIGDVRNQDFSRQLDENCDHRCAEANNMYSRQSYTRASDLSQLSIENKQSSLNSECHKNSRHQDVQIQEILLHSSQKLQMNDLKSTEPSIFKIRSKGQISFEKKESPQTEKIKGVNFESSIGHQYLKDIHNKSPSPQFYEIQMANQSLVKKSMNEPRAYVNFSHFRNNIATRYDRADPNWHTIMDSSDNPLPHHQLSLNLSLASSRRPNEVKSKYPMRQCMNIEVFRTPMDFNN